VRDALLSNMLSDASAEESLAVYVSARSAARVDEDLGSSPRDALGVGIFSITDLSPRSFLLPCVIAPRLPVSGPGAGVARGHLDAWHVHCAAHHLVIGLALGVALLPGLADGRWQGTHIK
jgi:hypothetical protein